MQLPIMQKLQLCDLLTSMQVVTKLNGPATSSQTTHRGGETIIGERTEKALGKVAITILGQNVGKNTSVLAAGFVLRLDCDR